MRFCFVVYKIKGHPTDDRRCAICYSTEDVNRFCRENNDIEIIRVIEEDCELEGCLKDVACRLLDRHDIDKADKKILKRISEGGFFIGRSYS